MSKFVIIKRTQRKVTQFEIKSKPFQPRQAGAGGFTIERNNLSHSRTKIWIHAIPGTKNGQPFIRRENEGQIYEHIIPTAKAEGY
jgi:starvation-inducible outer membrane lipoprotein